MARVLITPDELEIVLRGEPAVLIDTRDVRNVRIYFGSWNEWSRDPALPIETGYPFSRAA